MVEDFEEDRKKTLASQRKVDKSNSSKVARMNGANGLVDDISGRAPDELLEGFCRPAEPALPEAEVFSAAISEAVTTPLPPLESSAEKKIAQKLVNISSKRGSQVNNF